MLARDSRTSRIALVLSLVLLQLPGASRSGSRPGVLRQASARVGRSLPTGPHACG